MLKKCCFVFLTMSLLLFSDLAAAQGISIRLDEGAELTGRGVELFALLTVLSLAPGLAMMVTCFPFLITVLSILRQAIGLQQAPPNMVIVSLALFLSYFIMAPVFFEAWQNGIEPYLQGGLGIEKALAEVKTPFEMFMMGRTDPETLEALHGLRSGQENQAIGLEALLPSFMLSELARAFQIGFIIYLPFLIIDLVVATVLMSMGMMMVPPVVVSLPFKLAFFVVADGWVLISESLVRGYLP